MKKFKVERASLYCVEEMRRSYHDESAANDDNRKKKVPSLQLTVKRKGLFAARLLLRAQ
jgi:hypothetical protein